MAMASLIAIERWERRARRHGWWVLLLVAALCLLPGTGDLPLIDRDEPRFTRATVEMMETQQWIIPFFNGDYRFDKPPLTYWWMRLHFLLLGEGELTARLHSVVSSLLCAWAIFGMGWRMFNARAGFLAGFAFLTCLQVLIHGRLAVADMPMVLAVIVIQWAAWELLRMPRFKPFTRAFWLLWFAVAFGFLAKGPIAVLVPGLTLLAYKCLQPRVDADTRRANARLRWIGLAAFTVLYAGAVAVVAHKAPAELVPKVWQIGRAHV